MTILNEQPIPLWTGAGDASGVTPRVRCTLLWCRHCGHVEQPMTKRLKTALDLIYQSNAAQVSTEIGRGSWGRRRSRQITGLLQKHALTKGRSAIEIGCASGYLLRYLREHGFRDLIGIDPSARPQRRQRGIEYIAAMMPQAPLLGRTADLVVALCVFEHIPDLHGTFQWITKHLKNEGALFFEVPACEKPLLAGDPGLFIHEHIHYFTPSSLQTLLSSCGFSSIEIEQEGDSYFVLARRSGRESARIKPPVLFGNYGKRMKRSLVRVAAVAREGAIAFHGACNALHNVLNWTGIRKPFGVFDNDEMKVGREYFGVEVMRPSIPRLRAFRAIVVAPTVYFRDIEAQYRNMGFSGPVLPVCSGGML